MPVKLIFAPQTAAIAQADAIIIDIPAGKTFNFVTDDNFTGAELVILEYTTTGKASDSKPILFEGSVDASLSSTKSFQPITGPVAIAVGKQTTTNAIGCSVFF